VKPCGNEKNTLEFSLYPFQRLVYKLTNAQEWKVREIAASTFAGLLDLEDCLDAVRQITNSIGADSGCNDMHGTCLQISAILNINLGMIIQLDENNLIVIIKILSQIMTVLLVEKFSVARDVFLGIILQNQGLLNLSNTEEGRKLLSDVYKMSRSICSGRKSTKFCPNFVFEKSWKFAVQEALELENLDHINRIICDCDIRGIDYLLKTINSLCNESKALLK
jgi:hypothetical protein